MEEGCAAKRILATEGTPPCGAKGSLDLALYNPCFSGMTIFYTVYKENLNSGHRCLNLVSQHLCIYFKKERGGSPRDFALLKTAGSNSVWAVQQRPSWGDFAKHFWLAVGMRPNVAARLASKTGLSFLAQDRMMWKKKCYTDFRNSISPGSIENEVPIVNSSGSYRCLMLPDFFPKLLPFNTFCVAADLFDFVHGIKRQNYRFWS